jgi:hypothetical protein
MRQSLQMFGWLEDPGSLRHLQVESESEGMENGRFPDRPLSRSKSRATLQVAILKGHTDCRDNL